MKWVRPCIRPDLSVRPHMSYPKNIDIRELSFRQQFSDRVRLVFYICLMFLVVGVAYLASGPGGQGILIGGLVGTLAHWKLTSTSEVILPEAWMSAEARSIIERSRYRPLVGTTNHYRLELPRWMFFNQQDVFFDRDNHGNTVVVGPKNVLTMIKRKIVTP